MSPPQGHGWAHDFAVEYFTVDVLATLQHSFRQRLPYEPGVEPLALDQRDQHSIFKLTAEARCCITHTVLEASQ